MTNKQPRRGRPPRVESQGDGVYSTSVKGKVYGFRLGGDGRLRALGTPERDENFDYARTQVERVANTPVLD